MNRCCKLKLVFLEKRLLNTLAHVSMFWFPVERILKWTGFISNWKFPDCVHFVGERTGQVWRDKSLRVPTHEIKLRSCCSLIGHNNTQHCLCPARSQHSLDRLEMVRWESIPRGSSARAWKLSSRSDWLSLGLRGCWIPNNIMVQICYWRVYLGNETFSCRLM